jgi:hypothetical protein
MTEKSHHAISPAFATTDASRRDATFVNDCRRTAALGNARRQRPGNYFQ